MTNNTTVTFATPPTGSEAPPPAAPPAVADPNARPAWLPDKFKDAEQMAVAYGELEKRMGSGTSPPAADPPAAPPTADPPATPPPAEGDPPATVEAARAGLEKAGLSFDKFSKEIVEKGALTPESYAELAKAGYPKEMVDRFYEGQKAIAEQNTNSLMALMDPGGDAEVGRAAYADMVTWASANLSVEEKAAYNTAVASGSAHASLAIRGLQATYLAANPREPSLIRPGNRAAPDGDVYGSSAEMTMDMRDPRYAKDSAFRSRVEAKVARSNF